MRKEYYIEPTIKFRCIKELIVLFPTIFFQPSMYREVGDCVIDIWWLTFHIYIGTWKRKEVQDETN